MPFTHIYTQPDGFLGHRCACSRAEEMMSFQPVEMMSCGVPKKPVDQPILQMSSEQGSRLEDERLILEMALDTH